MSGFADDDALRAVARGSSMCKAGFSWRRCSCSRTVACARQSLLVTPILALMRSLSAVACARSVLLVTMLLISAVPCPWLVFAGYGALVRGSGISKAFTGDDAPHGISVPVGTAMCKAGVAGDDDAPRAGTFPVGTAMCKAGVVGDDDAPSRWYVPGRHCHVSFWPHTGSSTRECTLQLFTCSRTCTTHIYIYIYTIPHVEPRLFRFKIHRHKNVFKKKKKKRWCRKPSCDAPHCTFDGCGLSAHLDFLCGNLFKCQTEFLLESGSVSSRRFSRQPLYA